MAHINNLNQRARMECIVENLDTEDIKILCNWGGELYRDGIARGVLTTLGVIAVIGIVKFAKS